MLGGPSYGLVAGNHGKGNSLPGISTHKNDLHIKQFSRLPSSVARCRRADAVVCNNTELVGPYTVRVRRNVTATVLLGARGLPKQGLYSMGGPGVCLRARRWSPVCHNKPDRELAGIGGLRSPFVYSVRYLVPTSQIRLPCLQMLL